MSFISGVSCGCDAIFAGMAVCHCQKCHYSFADRPAYDAHRRLARPCIHPTALGMELIGNKGLGLGSSGGRLTDSGGAAVFVSVLGRPTGPPIYVYPRQRGHA